VSDPPRAHIPSLAASLLSAASFRAAGFSGVPIQPCQAAYFTELYGLPAPCHPEEANFKIRDSACHSVWIVC
jgi:hypothetical protein